jgi:hypothetical protein
MLLERAVVASFYDIDREVELVIFKAKGVDRHPANALVRAVERGFQIFRRVFS